MSKQDIFDKLKPVLAQSLSVSVHEITPEASFKDDLGADSLDVVQTSMDVEKAFDLIFSDGEMEKIVTVQDLVDIVYSHQSIHVN